MQMIKNFKILAAGALMAVLLVAGSVGCEKGPRNPEVIAGTIKITPSELTFEDNGWSSKSVEITDVEDWYVSSTPDWLAAVKDGNSLVVTPKGNVDFRDRTGEVIVRAGTADALLEGKLLVRQAKSAGVNIKVLDTPYLPANCISSNGRYVGGTFQSISFVYDRATNEFIQVGSGAREITAGVFITELADPSDISKGSINLYGVSDNGIIVGSAGKLREGASEGSTNTNDRYTVPFSYNINTKEFKWLPLNILSQLGNEMEGRSPSAESHAGAISADGRTILGYVGFPRLAPGETDFPGIRIQYVPVIWRDGQPTVLAHPLSGLNDGDNTSGYLPIALSADGEIAAGAVVTRTAQRVAVYWRLSEPEKLNYLRRDDPVFFKNITEAGYTLPSRYPMVDRISADGKVFTGTIVDTSSGERIPYSCNIETGSTVVANNVGGVFGTFTLPDGTLVCSAGGGFSFANATFYQNDTAMTMAQWLEKNYGAKDLPTENYSLRDVSAGGKAMVGFNRYGNAVIVSL